VTIAVAPAIADAELHRAMRKAPDSLDAWAAYQRGLWHSGKASAEDNALAQKFFQQAVDLDPSFAGGYKGLSRAQGQAADYQGRGLPEALSSAEALARRAVALDGADAEGRSRLANALYRQGDYEGGLAEAEQALSISPNLADAHGERGATLIFSGRLKEGLAALERCVRLDPRRSAGPFEPDRVGALSLARIRGRGRGRETRNPVIPRVSQHIPLARRRPRSARPVRSGEGSA
jgi:adenylate cyclase